MTEIRPVFLFSRILGLLIISVLTIAGCAGMEKVDWPPSSIDVPARHELTQVPFFPQEEYQCGPAALATVLDWSGLSIEPDDLTDKVFTPSLKGSLQMAMISAARRSGRVAYLISDRDDLFAEIAAGNPVVVLQNLGLSWIPVWHYAVAVGYDFPEEHVILRSGATARRQTSMHTFDKTWRRSEYWGLLVLKPSQLPATVKQEPYLTALVGLERARQYQAAVKGYGAALTRWPQSLPALMGMGNSYYALGRLGNSEQAFRKTVELHPQSGSARNNLAQVLFELGRRREALAEAKKAVELGGPMAGTYQQTLDEIQLSLE